MAWVENSIIIKFLDPCSSMEVAHVEKPSYKIAGDDSKVAESAGPDSNLVNRIGVL